MDTHTTFKNLVQSGLTDAQAEAIVAGFRDSRESRNTLVTEEKLDAVKDFLRAETSADIAALENRLLRWIIGSGVAITAAMIGGYFV